MTEATSNGAPVAGDETTGRFTPPEFVPVGFDRVDPGVLERLRDVRGLTATASDVLDELGYQLAVPAHVLAPRLSIGRPVVGHALTLRYLPERTDEAHARRLGGESKLAHHQMFELAGTGDVVVIDVSGAGAVSSLGGVAAAAAVAAGVGGCIVDGGVRDVDELADLGLPVWSRFVTPRTGKWRVEAVAINAPVSCGGVQVRPGDLALADETGVCFVPPEVTLEVIERVLEVSRDESAILGDARRE